MGIQTTQMHAILFKGAGCLERGKLLHTYCNAESRPWKRVANRRAVVAASSHHYRQYNFPVSHRRTAKCSHDITASKVCAYVRWAHPSGILFCIPRDVLPAHYMTNNLKCIHNYMQACHPSFLRSRETTTVNKDSVHLLCLGGTWAILVVLQ